MQIVDEYIPCDNMLKIWNNIIPCMPHIHKLEGSGPTKHGVY